MSTHQDSHTDSPTTTHGYGPGHGREAATVMVVPRLALHTIRQYADLYAMQGDKGWEACGLLGGVWVGGVVQVHQLAALANTATDPHHYFRIAPWDQYNTGDVWAGQGLEVVGVWHSHPSSGTRPSHTDQAALPPGLLSVIHSVPNKEVCAWQDSTQVRMQVEG